MTELPTGQSKRDMNDGASSTTPMMHLDTDQALLHHLVASDGVEDVTAHDMTSPVGVFMAAVATVVTLVAVMAMCVCRKKRPSNKETGEPMLQEMTPVVDNKTNHTNVTTSLPVEETDVVVTVDPRNSRHSNGSVIMGKDAAENGRPKSHDQRALPEIPAGSMMNGVMQTDDEDDDEGHYDIINRNRAMAASLSAASVSNTSTAAARGLNLYEKVGGSSDMSLAGVKTTDSATDFAGLRNTNPYATVDGIGSADYAHIDEQGKRTPKKGAVLRVQGIETQSGASTDTLNESYASVPPPPVPDKNFVSPDAAASLTPNTLASISPQGSPGLPLRNSVALALAEDGGLAAAAPMASIVPNADGAPVMEINPDNGTGETSTGKREPPYSSVTARESLANLRQRQAIERQQLQPLPHDATYESVNYDQITSPANANLNTMTSDRNSQASDLYAEIDSRSGENSTRSSVYAKVGDVSSGSAVRETPAPTPPPMDFLKHLPKESSKNDDEMPDPGYSIIRRPRPASAYSARPTPPQSGSPDHNESGDQPVYAVVDKARRQRNTVCVSEDVNRNLDLQDSTETLDQLYAQVNKQRHVPTHLDFPQMPPSSYIGAGARPKVRTNGNNNPTPPMVGAVGGTPQARTSCSSDIDPAYQTIPSDENIVESGYEDIEIHNQITELSSITDFDPNYECVRTESMNRLRLVSPGVATEISASDMGNNPHGMVHINDHHVDSTFWQRNEHVYQEIGTAQRQHLGRMERLAERHQISTDL